MKSFFPHCSTPDSSIGSLCRSCDGCFLSLVLLTVWWRVLVAGGVPSQQSKKSRYTKVKRIRQYYLENEIQNNKRNTSRLKQRDKKKKDSKTNETSQVGAESKANPTPTTEPNRLPQQWRLLLCLQCVRLVLHWLFYSSYYCLVLIVSYFILY